MRSLKRTTCLLGALAFLPSCATLPSFALSPLTGTIDALRLAVDDHWGANALWRVPYCILLSPLVGLFTGMNVDFGFLEHGNYSDPPYSDIFRPYRHMPGH